MAGRDLSWTGNGQRPYMRSITIHHEEASGCSPGSLDKPGGSLASGSRTSGHDNILFYTDPLLDIFLLEYEYA